jgi:hypothetical protein
LFRKEWRGCLHSTANFFLDLFQKISYYNIMNNLGIDLGRTIKGPTKEMYSEPFPDAFGVISKLVKRFNNSYIISRVNSEQRKWAIKWFEDRNFYNITGIPKENIYYCFDRRDKNLFVKGLEIGTFIDDRPDVLLQMNKHMLRILFNPSDSDKEKFKYELLQLTILNTWKEIEKFYNL